MKLKELSGSFDNLEEASDTEYAEYTHDKKIDAAINKKVHIYSMDEFIEQINNRMSHYEIGDLSYSDILLRYNLELKKITVKYKKELKDAKA